MATFKIVLDTRTKKKDNKYNLAVRMVNGNDVMYLNISKITQQQYDQTFIKKSKDEKSIEFRETCTGYITKCERIFSELKPFNKERLRELFYDKDKEVPKTLLLKDLLKYYIEQNEFITIRTKGRYQTSINVLNTFKKDVTVGDITVNFLKRFDKYFRDKGGSPATVSGYLTDARRIINYFREIVKLIPKEYEYPFGKGGYSIKSYNPKKIVLKSDEIQSVIDLLNLILLHRNMPEMCGCFFTYAMVSTLLTFY